MSGVLNEPARTKVPADRPGRRDAIRPDRAGAERARRAERDAAREPHRPRQIHGFDDAQRAAQLGHGGREPGRRERQGRRRPPRHVADPQSRSPAPASASRSGWATSRSSSPTSRTPSSPTRRCRWTTPTTRRKVAVEVIQQLMREAYDENSMSMAGLLGVGVAVSGPVNPIDSRVQRASVVPTWAGTEIRKVFEPALERPIFADNESNCAALAEMMWGAARRLQRLRALQDRPRRRRRHRLRRPGDAPASPAAAASSATSSSIPTASFAAAATAAASSSMPRCGSRSPTRASSSAGR